MTSSCASSANASAFAVGLAASRHGWLAPLAASSAARRAGWLALVGGPLLLLGVMVAGGPITKDHNPYFGGPTPQALGLRFVGAILRPRAGPRCALVVFAAGFDRASPALAWLGDRAFAVYIFHAPVLVALTMMFAPPG